MSNMSYCRFTNTLEDLRDCYAFMCSSFDDSWLDGLSKEERKAAISLLHVCAGIAEDFQHLLYPSKTGGES